VVLQGAVAEEVEAEVHQEAAAVARSLEGEEEVEAEVHQGAAAEEVVHQGEAAAA